MIPASSLSTSPRLFVCLFVCFSFVYLLFVYLFVCLFVHLLFIILFRENIHTIQYVPVEGIPRSTERLEVVTSPSRGSIVSLLQLFCRERSAAIHIHQTSELHRVRRFVVGTIRSRIIMGLSSNLKSFLQNVRVAIHAS